MDDPTACRARATRVEPVEATRLPVPRPGYHHLGATTMDEWSGVLGRLTVRDPRLRAGSFDSRARSWVFYEEYALAAGDRVWVYLEAGGPAWRAWLWWGGRWQLLAAPELPLGDRALLEQYVEVHQDRAGPPIRVPRIQVDRVQVRPAPEGPMVDWLPEAVPTVTPIAATDYCLDWHGPYHTWSAGSCPAGATVQE